jgi:NADPH2:quinone reductase
LGPEPDGPAETGSWRVADRVALAPMLVDRTGMGVLRQFGVYDRSALLPVPANYSDRQGAAYWNAIPSIAGAMDMAGLGPGTSRGKTIAFTAAAGGIATVGLQLARAWGAETLATTRRQEKATRLSPLATHVAVVRQPRELVAALRGTRFERGIDVIIDPIGGDMIASGLEALGSGDQLVSYEAVSGHTGSYDIMDLMAKDLSLHGYTFFRPLRMRGFLIVWLRSGWRARTRWRRSWPAISASTRLQERSRRSPARNTSARSQSRSEVKATFPASVAPANRNS